ncbi:Uncharacterized protein HZ326_27848 [Fusarium oxysporum f. sp. albedinis]|nr:Uncharacterized protein HZ326_27848 [Fusarium oxysporum f. sp. albedinis]
MRRWSCFYWSCLGWLLSLLSVRSNLNLLLLYLAISNYVFKQLSYKDYKIQILALSIKFANKEANMPYTYCFQVV